MNFPIARLQRKLGQDPKPFRMGDYIFQGFNFTNDNLGLLVAFILVSGVIGVIAQSLPFIGLILSFVISPILSIGYYQFVYSVKRTQKAEFGEFFKGFSKMGPLLLTYLMIVVISLLAILPGLLILYKAGLAEWLAEMMDAYPQIDDVTPISEIVDMSLFAIGLIVMAILGSVVSLLFYWAMAIVWFYEIGPIEALEMSRKLISRDWLKLLLFLIVSGFIGVSGILLCGIGVLYTAPAMSCAQAFAFADATDLFKDDGTDQTELIDHFIA